MNFNRPDWNLILDDFGMLFINPFTYDYHGFVSIDGALAPLSQLGAIYLAIFGPTREARIFGRTVLIWVVATATVIAFLHNFYYYTGLIYQGPDARHFIPNSLAVLRDLPGQPNFRPGRARHRSPVARLAGGTPYL